jgi:shikimate dehydrogenase
LNVTIPYKIKIIPFLTKLDDKASEIEAVNVIKKNQNGDWIGFNSDYYGFLSTLYLFGDAQFWANKSALVFGTGGSAKAIQAVLRDLNISWKSISRNQTENSISYADLEDSEIQNSTLLVNCTPLGMFPDVESSVPINYKMLNEQHVVIDLVYNPQQSKFLRLAEENGAKTKNGLHMLISQAEKAWEIWNS